jgi:hypothetical protein
LLLSDVAGATASLSEFPAFYGQRGNYLTVTVRPTE